ncbi:MAG: CPBP family intramembrane metalloprotease [Firmicutes bacterium]|nr:CPBP family intramembrane metalloprotease [Bacillota bacterium]
MINTKICPKCGTYYEDNLPECPACHTPNFEVPKAAQPAEKPNGIIQMPAFRHVLAFITGWLGLQVIATIIILLVRLFLSRQYSDTAQVDAIIASVGMQMTLNTSIYLFLFVCLLAIIYPVVPKIFKDMGKFKAISRGFLYGLLLVGSGMVVSILYSMLKVNMSSNANETAIVSMMTTYPFWSVVAFVIAGPLCEEITYRLGMFSLVRRLNRYVAYILVIILFGLIHFSFETIGTAAVWNELLNLPYYMIAGGILCYVYEKEGLATSMYAHVTNNLISFLTSLFLTNVLTHIL